jgi:signal transduction histidine kinase
VAIRASSDNVRFKVSDNGRGFPFHGTYDLPALARSGHGPRTLKERLTLLGGTMSIHSTANGASIEAIVPFASEVAS